MVLLYSQMSLCFVNLIAGGKFKCGIKFYGHLNTDSFYTTEREICCILFTLPKCGQLQSFLNSPQEESSIAVNKPERISLVFITVNSIYGY
jgi:hypothetical protein